MKKMSLLLCLILSGIFSSTSLYATSVGPTVLEITSRDEMEKPERVFVVFDHEKNIYSFIKCPANLNQCAPFGSEELAIENLYSVVAILKEANSSKTSFMSTIYHYGKMAVGSVALGTIFYGLLSSITSFPNTSKSQALEFDANMFIPSITELWMEKIFQRDYSMDNFYIDIYSPKVQTGIASMLLGVLGMGFPYSLFTSSSNETNNDYSDPMTVYRYSVPSWSVLLEAMNNL